MLKPFVDFQQERKVTCRLFIIKNCIIFTYIHTYNEKKITKKPTFLCTIVYLPTAPWTVLDTITLYLPHKTRPKWIKQKNFFAGSIGQYISAQPA